MKYFEATVTVILKHDIFFKDVQEEIGKFINFSMLHDNNLKTLHRTNGYKYYVYSGLWPIEQKKVYLANNVYIFKIRAMQALFFKNLISCIKQTNNNVFTVLAIEKKQYSRRIIHELYTLTPFVVSIGEKPWMPNQHNLEILINSLQNNAAKKYKQLYGTEIFTNSFIQQINILNEKPFAMNYKNMSLLGHKAKITVNKDEQSQKLAFITLGAGLAEKNSSLGTGFCYFH
jgi:CRISPR-associated endoribonuclease Cas6